MSYKTFDIKGQEVVLRDLQDKGAWCVDGASKEQTFVLNYPSLGLMINPEKETNAYAPDLLIKENGGLADLKTQNTPFFKAGQYGINPQYAVTFNEKDFIRYTELYRGIEVYFWVDWQTIKFVSSNIEINVLPMIGIWRLSFENMIEAVKKAPLHTYMQRINDQNGNAKGSYVLDLSTPYFIRVI